MSNPLNDLREIATISGYDFETSCRTHACYAFLGNNTGVCKVLSKYKMLIDTRDLGVAPHFILDGYWETWLTQSLASIVQPGDTCIDVGANFGYYSILMSAMAGKTGKTIAIEPNPELCRLLRATAGLNDPGFGVAEVALSDEAGKTVLMIPEGFFGDASILTRKDRPTRKMKKVKVETITLDELLTKMNISKVDVMKIDVEGAEPQVFEGMKQTLAQNPGIRIIIEYSPYLYEDAVSFTQFLFSRFAVSRIKDVEKPVQLSEYDIPGLVSLTDHTDLCLEPLEGFSV